MNDFSVTEKDESRSGSVPVLFGHQVIVAFYQQSAVLENLFVNQFQSAKNSFTLFFTDRIFKSLYETIFNKIYLVNI